MSSYDVIVKIIADGKKAVAEFDRAGKAADRMAKRTTDASKKAEIDMKRIGRQAGIAGAAMVGAAGTVAFAMKSWVNSAQEAERAQMQLESSVRGAYGASSSAVKGFEAQAKAIQKVTVASDEDVMSIQAMLVQFGLTQRQVTTLTPLVVDIARKWGIDYVTAAKAVEKAAAGKTTGLKKLGIQVDETKAKTDPYIATVEALRRAAGGFAEQEGKTFAGQTAILKNQMDELKESLGRGVLSVLTKVLPVVNDVGGAFTSLDDHTGGLIGSVTAVGTGFAALSGTALLAFSALVKLKTAYADAAAQSEAFSLAQSGIEGAGVVATGAVLGATLAKAVNDALYHGAEHATDAYKKAFSATTGRAVAIDYFNAAGAEASKGGNVISGVLRGIAKDYKTVLTGQGDLNNIWREMARGGADKAFKNLAASSPEAAQKLLQFADANDVARKRMEAMGADFAKYRRILRDVYDTNKNGRVEGIEKVQFRADSLKDVQAYIDAVNGATEAQSTFVKATISVRDAQNSVKDAEKNLADARKENDPTKIADAQSQLQSAYMGVYDANRQVQDAAIKNAEAQLDLQNLISDPKKFKESIDHWGDLVKAMGKDSPIGQAIQGRIDDWVAMKIVMGQPLELNDATILTALADLHEKGRLTAQQLTDLNQKWNAGSVDTSGVSGALDTLKGKLGDFRTAWQQFWADMPGSGPAGPTNPYIPPTSDAVPHNRTNTGTGYKRASGGPVAGGIPYMVGEQGPELFVPIGNGMIVPNGKLGGTTAVATSGGDVNINIYGTPLMTKTELGALVFDGLKALERRNGALPLKVA